MTILTFLMLVPLLARHGLCLSRPQCLSCEENSCDCSRRNLSQVPLTPSKLTTGLDLSFNRLKTVLKDDFVAFASLQSLIMNNNLVEAIHGQAFVPLTHLVKLDLSFNRLVTLSAEWFETLVALQHLNLLGNRYSVLGEGKLFQPLKNLKTLYFGGYYLQIVRKSDFSGLGALEEINFDGRNLQVYAKGSLRQIRSVKHVTLGLKGPFKNDHALVEDILSDVTHPNTTLTFTNTYFAKARQMSPFHVVRDGGTTRVILKDVNITMDACMTFLNMVSRSNITMMALEETKFFLGFFSTYPLAMTHLHEAVLRNVDIPQFYSFPVLFFLQPLLRVVKRVSVINSNLFVIPCPISSTLSKLEYMDISENILTDVALSQLMCDGVSHLVNLQTFNISRNQLKTINSHLFSKLDKLENIDMSGNTFHRMPATCDWPPRLRFLNLSSSYLKEVTPCLPPGLHILDVSYNALTVFNIKLPLLKELYISGNKLRRLPEGGLYPHLALLFIQNNILQLMSRDTLSGYNHLKTLKAAANTYICECDFVALMSSDLTHHGVTARELKLYICDSPDTVRGETVADARLSVFECHTALAFSSLCVCILAVFLLFAGLCHKFSVLWYMRMTWAWLRAKRKPKLKKGKPEYDAFVSYSDMDSAWVEGHLVPELEQAEPPLRLCLHKRDFLPGGWILDNIIDAIEKSHRTLFVVSKHFVQSEWCKYELDYTHFRLFDQNDDTVVLILLEPIDKETIPRKFCKLRRVMNSRTYLEWPEDENQIPRFWQTLRTAVNRPDAHGEDGMIETEDI